MSNVKKKSAADVRVATLHYRSFSSYEYWSTQQLRYTAVMLRQCRQQLNGPIIKHRLNKHRICPHWARLACFRVRKTICRD